MKHEPVKQGFKLSQIELFSASVVLKSYTSESIESTKMNYFERNCLNSLSSWTSTIQLVERRAPKDMNGLKHLQKCLNYISFDRIAVTLRRKQKAAMGSLLSYNQ